MKSSEFIRHQLRKHPQMSGQELEQILLFLFQQPANRRHYLLMEDPLMTDDQLLKLDNILRQRKKGVPLAYILGTCYFYNLELQINRHCLIPRPDTELLVDATLEILDQFQQPVYLDMACGSGAVALAVAKSRPAIQAYGSDICPNAIKVAQSNAKMHQLPVPMILSNWSAALAARSIDCISANPPYIAYEELHLMNRETSYEPSLALFAANNGLAPYEQIALDAVRVLKTDGWLLLEHGYRQAQHVRNILQRHGFTSVTTIYDLNNHPRVTQGQIANERP